MATEQGPGFSGTYRKRPVEIQAFRYGVDPLPNWFLDRVRHNRIEFVCLPGDPAVPCEIHTLEGTMYAQPGDWIIRGVKGEVYPCKPDIFEHSYEWVSTNGD